jgi:hypothetical protein
MDNKTSAGIIQDYAVRHNQTILDAIMQLDHLVSQDWIHSLPGAPAGYQRQTTLEQDQAVTVFCRNRQHWIRDALSLGLNLQGFTRL